MYTARISRDHFRNHIHILKYRAARSEPALRHSQIHLRIQSRIDIQKGLHPPCDYMCRDQAE